MGDAASAAGSWGQNSLAAHDTTRNSHNSSLTCELKTKGKTVASIGQRWGSQAEAQGPSPWDDDIDCLIFCCLTIRAL